MVKYKSDINLQTVLHIYLICNQKYYCRNNMHCTSCTTILASTSG